MIDIPVEVKDALKNGTYKKNYRFIVQDEIQKHDVLAMGVIDNLGKIYTVFEEGDYVLYADVTEAYGAIVGYLVYPNDTRERILFYFSPYEETLNDLGVLPVGTIIDFSNASFSRREIAVGLKDNIIETSEWVDSFTIDNNTLIKETVSIDERMCSEDTIKFGLCEGSSLEFQYFNHDSILGKRIKAMIDIEYGNNENDWYTIPMGFFIVEKCSRQASTGIIKVTAYNKLQSKYLDQKANKYISGIVSDTLNDDEATVYAIESNLLGEYKIHDKPLEEIDCMRIGYDEYTSNVFRPLSINFKLKDSSTVHTSIILEAEGLDFGFIDANSEVQIECNEYLVKAQRAIASFRKYVFENIQEPENFWKSFVNSMLYQELCAVTVGINQPVRNTSFYFTQPGITTQKFDYTKDLTKLKNIYDARRFWFLIPRQLKIDHSLIYSWTVDRSDWVEKGDVTVSVMPLTQIESYIMDLNTIPDVTLRELQTATYEMNCMYGQLDRETDLFAGKELNSQRLYPQTTLYPDNALYPMGAQLSAEKAMYSKLWADEGNVHKWRYLIITYKGLDSQGNETEKTLQRTVDEHGTDNYNMSDNWLFRNLVWAEEDVAAYANAMVAKMKNITWFPFEMWAAGLPYLETGDQIEIPLGEETYTSYILQRQLKGIQNLQDTYINGTLDIF